MKPSTHKKIKSFRSKLINTYYKMMYPLAWMVEKLEEYNNNRLKRKATLERVAKLLAKDIYKYMCKSNYDNAAYVIIAEWVNDEEYITPQSSLEYFTKFKSKSRRLGKMLDWKDRNEDFFKKVMYEFDKLNEYTFVETNDKYKNDKWDFRGYKYTYYFGVKV
ncbi:hypothetical protein [Lysinibacillus sp. Bpr_S20]|uniref:hypothetical protein n=1 Tax=Lysinibacillus sp. Bpr_S20 TaxID=2933964 RepID=UPI0020124151|nr:hypothetical protein [Lysinibacillus sp. Bpr_S20]MCL1700800.1 hypothetical protein [Lysinibacillus sp. Bpr_S20]